MQQELRLVSHHLCPYVQRAVIVAAEKHAPLERVLIDLANKPAWFSELSPTGKVPLLQIGDTVLFESAAICEYLDETIGVPLMPSDPLRRAQHRAWTEFASGTLSDIAGLYNAPDEAALEAKRNVLVARFSRLGQVVSEPWFDGDRFGLVDAAFGPVFRYLDTFESEASLYLISGLPRLAAWRSSLAARPSVAGAVEFDYPDRLKAFLLSRNSMLSSVLRSAQRVH